MALLLETPQDLVVMVAARLCKRLRGVVVFSDMRLALLHVTKSFGVASLAPGNDGEALMAAADAALYRAKEEGRNRVCCQVTPRAGAAVMFDREVGAPG